MQAKIPTDFQMVPMDYFANVRELNFGDKINFPVVAKGKKTKKEQKCFALCFKLCTSWK